MLWTLDKAKIFLINEVKNEYRGENNMKKTYTRSECKNEIIVVIIALVAFLYIAFSASQGEFFGTGMQIYDGIRIPMVIMSILFIIYGIYYYNKLQGYLKQMDILGVDYLTPNQYTHSQSRNNQQTYNKTTNQQQRQQTQQRQQNNANGFRFYFCPQCGQKLRIPSGRGNVNITCPKCHRIFSAKS